MNRLYKKKMMIEYSIIGLVLMFTVGCGAKKVCKECYLPKPLAISSQYEVTDRQDPAQLICKGISQSEKGNNESAAEFFNMAAQKQACDGENKLQLKALFAKANEHLKGGNQPAFIATMKEVDRNLDHFSRANLSKQESALMALYDMAMGKPYSSFTHPSEVRELFYGRN